MALLCCKVAITFDKLMEPGENALAPSGLHLMRPKLAPKATETQAVAEKLRRLS